MKKYIIFLLLLFVFQTRLQAQYTVGSGGDFTDLAEAFDGINNSGTNIGDVELQIISNLTVSVTQVLYEDGYGGSNYSSVTIYPVSSGLTISGSVNGPLIDLNGATNVIIDGRVNRAGAADMTISNTNTGTSASVIRFIESAGNNTVSYCYIKGSGTGASGGILHFSTASQGNGNDGNTIDHNYISSSAGGRPVNAISSSGTATRENSGNTISNNEIYNFLRNSTTSAGINLSSNTTGWIISGNSFYETASFAPSANVTFYAIQINNTSGTGFNIEGNYIGGKAASCGGTAWTKTTGSSPYYNNPFFAINLNVGTAASSSVKNNTIKNFSWSNSLNANWTAINIEAGAVIVGSLSGNIIGDASSAGSITVTGGASNTSIYGINIASTGNIECRNNSVANMLNATTSSGSITAGINFSGGTGTNIVGENFIHHLEVSGSSTGSAIYGIRISSGATTYPNNIISLGGNTSTTIYGIYETGISGNNNSLYFNTIYLSGSPASGTAPSYALYSAVTTNTRNFRNNILFNARSNSGASGSHYAIYIVSSGGTITTDYNDYYVSGTGGVLGYLSGDKTTLADWKTATGQDANSVSADPLLSSAGGTTADNYTPAAGQAGTAGTGVLTDFNGSTRSLTTPSMGAFETGVCTNPTSGGTIATAQSGCSPFNPAAFTSTLPASGQLGTLEYKWQFSVTSSSTGFSDISSSNSPTYDAGDLTQTTWYKRLARVTCQADWSGAAESNVIEVTVNPTPSASITGTLTACQSTTLTAVTDASSPSYVWYRDFSILIGEVSSTLYVTTDGPYKVKVTDGTTSCYQTSSASTVSINPLPTATITGTLNACVSTTLTANSDAASPSYTWYKDNVEISGEVSSTLSVTQSGGYKFKVKNGITNCEQTSATSAVTINPLPTATISGTLSACGSSTLTAGTDAASPSYVWYRDNVEIGGEISATLIVSSSGSYKVKVKNGITNCEQTSSPSSVTITPLPSASITGTLTACGSTTLTTVTDAASPSFIWYKDDVVIPGEVSSTLNVTTGGSYKVKVTDGLTSCEQTSSPSAVTINSYPSEGLQVDGTTTICSGTGTNITVSSSESGVNYQLRNDAGDINIGSPVAGTGGDILLPTGNLTSTTSFNILATNAASSCSVELNQTETVTVDPVSAGGTLSGGTPSITYGDITGTLTLTSYAGSIIKWQKMEGAGSWQDITNTSATYSETPVAAGSWQFRVEVKSGVCPEDYSNNVLITVAQKDLTIQANDQTKSYGTTFSFIGSEFTATGLVTGDAVSSATITSAATPATAGVTGSPYAITISSAIGTGLGNYLITYTNGSFTVSKALLSYIADPQNKVTGTANPVLTYSSSGWQNGEDESVLSTVPQISTTVDASTLPGIYAGAITISGGADDNYDFNYVAADFTVTKLLQSITFSPLSDVTYGDADIDPGASSSSGLAVSYSSDNTAVASIVNDKIHLAGAGSASITASQPGDNEYEPATDVLQTITVNKADLTFTADDKTRVYNTPNPGFSYTITGFVNSETESVLDVLPAASSTAIQSTETGTYPITITGGNDNNYNYLFVPGLLTITKGDQVITFNTYPQKLLVKDTYTLVATSTSDLPVTYESLDTDIATVSGDKVTGISNGNARLRAYNAGDQNYNAGEAQVTTEVYSSHQNIMNLFTPNNDGINDKWELPELATWGKCSVKVYSRWGQLVFSEKDYNNLWDGTSNGKPLPEGPYYFIIETENSGMVKGTVNIVR